MRLSPFDPWAFAAFGSLALGQFLRGRYDRAVQAAYKAVQSNPGHSINYVLLAAMLAKVGRLEEAKVAAARVLKLHPAFRYARYFSGVNARRSLPPRWVKCSVPPGCRNSATAQTVANVGSWPILLQKSVEACVER